MKKHPFTKSFSTTLGEFPLYAFYHDQTQLELHDHEFIELVYVCKGQGHHYHESQRYPIHAGDSFFINTGEAHGYEALKNLQIVNILFTQSFINPYLPLLQSIDGFPEFFSLEPMFRRETSFRYKLHLSSDTRLIVERLINDLITELRVRPNGFQALCTGIFIEMITILCRAFRAQNKQTSTGDLKGKEEAVAQAISYLESEYDKEISLHDVASSVCLSVSRLAHVFKEATGTSLMDYLLRYRLDRARELLRDRKTAVSQVAYAVGFHDPGYFSRAFKKYFGHSPRESIDGPPTI